MIRRQLDSQKYISFAEYYSSNKYIEVIHASRNIIPDLRPMLEILHTQVTMIMMTRAVRILRTFSRRPAERGLPIASLPYIEVFHAYDIFLFF